LKPLETYPSPAIFLADCHLPLILRAGQEDWHERVLRFLYTDAQECQTLFLVGDIFDFWFEWRHSVPGAAFKVLAALHQLAREGRRVVYIGGNHDGHPGGFLEREVGLEVSRKPIDAEIDGKLVHIIHGDGIAPADRGYRALRRMVRWPPTEAIYRLIHPDFGIWFAHKVSKVSRQQFSGKKVWAPDSYREYARRKLDEGYNYVVMGHRHEAEFIAHPNGGFVAIGDWIRSGSYGVFQADEMQLKKFNK
jgi:UDP-2,3-diacylglucosamine hydrolase